MPAVPALLALLLRATLAYPTPSHYELTEPRRLEGGGAGPSYALTAGGRAYLLHLLPRRALLAPGFAVYSRSADGSLEAERGLPLRVDCLLQGWVEGLSRARAALSTCRPGLRGFLQTSVTTYGVEPSDYPDQHLLYRLEDVGSSPRNCFTVATNRTALEHRHHALHRAQHPPARPLHRQLRLYVIIDHQLALHYDTNATLLTEVTLHILNMADAMFAPLNLRLMLHSLEIWNTGDFVKPSADLQTFLQDLATWKEENVAPRHQVDMTLLLRKQEIQSATGASYMGEICWGRNTVMFVAFTMFSRGVSLAVASNVAHHIGHSLGMHHDTGYTTACHCPLLSCIMFPGGVTATAFTDCSIKHYQSFVAQGAGFCLQAVPSATALEDSRPYCGDKVVEGDEECDCGTLQECVSDPCCDVACKLKSTAQCSLGKCCQGCQFVKQGTPCRKPVSDCDLAEYCNGTSAFCPEDVYSQDGSPCNHNRSFCVSNTCYDYGKHCRQLFGKGATVASSECFSAVNTNGDRFGNCGFEAKGVLLKKCAPSDVMCGRVQCDSENDIRAYNSHFATVRTPTGKHQCWSVDHHYSYDIPDIGAVEDGAQCGIAKVCLARKCVDLSSLKHGCDVQENCNGNGVCNNNNNCHCNKGWAPPDCKHKGHGGSIDSGPLIKDSFISYVPIEDEFEFKDAKICPIIAAIEKEQKEEEERIAQEQLKKDLTIGLGVAVPVVAVSGIAVAVVFRHELVAAFV